jgi:hypothetical protein
MDWWGEFPRLEPGDGQKGMHMMWQNGLPIVLLLFLILSLVLSFVIITKHVIIMISSWRSWHKCFLNHSQTNPLLRRLKRVRESRRPSPSTRNFFVYYSSNDQLASFCFRRNSFCFRATLFCCDVSLLLSSCFVCVVWCSVVVYLPSFFLHLHKVLFLSLFSITPFFSFVPSFEAAEVAC